MSKRRAARQVAFDARGVARWERAGAGGRYEAVPNESAMTTTLNADRLSLAETPPQPVSPYGSYGRMAAAEKSLKKRSSLDYMRALSEVIKRERASKKMAHGK